MHILKFNMMQPDNQFANYSFCILKESISYFTVNLVLNWTSVQQMIVKQQLFSQ